MAVLGLQDPLRPEVPHAVEQCKRAGGCGLALGAVMVVGQGQQRAWRGREPGQMARYSSALHVLASGLW